MIIRQLIYLTALAREKHFGRAAASCNVSQPTLSAAIQQLEADLGVPIVERGQRFKGLTAEGQRVLEWGHRILADLRGPDPGPAGDARGPDGPSALRRHSRRRCRRCRW